MTQPTKRGVGRPSKGPDARTTLVGVKTTAESRALWEAAAEIEKKSLSGFVAIAADERAAKTLKRK